MADQTVLITGASGLLGSALKRQLLDSGWRIRVLVREARHANGSDYFFWDPETDRIDANALDGVDHIVHLAGANLSEKRWSKKRKRVIIDSRVRTANLLFRMCQDSPRLPQSFITASAVGYYGQGISTTRHTESFPPGSGFPAEVCVLWEEAADAFAALGMRVVKFRCGVILSHSGGGLPKMLTSVKLGLGAPLGTGKQLFPWVHLEDAVRAFAWALAHDQAQGPYNLVAPEATTNNDLMRALRKQWHKPLLFPVIPAVLLRSAYGEMAGMLLDGKRVVPERLMDAGFDFTMPTVEEALGDLHMRSFS